MTEPVLEFPWHKQTWDKFTHARSHDHLPHALLISGAEGIGKLEFAKKLVKSLLCFRPVNNQYCDQCNGCKTYDSVSNPDYLELQVAEDKKQISVDQIRGMSKFITLSRSFDAYRVILIHPVEAMNNNAANSLLKSLEEPANNTIIILLATHLNQVLPTIKSRCQLLTIPTPSNKQALAWLQTNAPSLDNTEELLGMCFGRPLLAFNVSEEDFNLRNELAEDLLHIMSEDESATVIAKKWEKRDVNNMLKWQISWLQGFIRTDIVSNESRNEASSSVLQNLNKINGLLSTDKQWLLYEELLKQRRYVHTSVNPLIFIENMLILWFQASRQ